VSAPLLWIVLPALLGIVLFVIPGERRWPGLSALAVGALLALAAWIFPLGRPTHFVVWPFQIEQEMSILGRSLVMVDDLRWLVSAWYGAASLWMLGALLTGSGGRSTPLMMSVTAVLVGALSVQPPLYAPLFLTLAALLCIPILSPPEGGPARGPLLFVTFQLLALPLMMVAGARLAGLEGSPPGLEAVTRPAALLGFGFAFLLAVFPFHAWVPVVTRTSRPMAAGFVIVFLTTGAALLGIQQFDRFVWLRETEGAFAILRFVGVLVVTTGGFWLAFEQHPGRQMGFSALVDGGLVMLALGLGGEASLLMVWGLLVVRSLGYLVWAAGLGVIQRQAGSLSVDAIHAAARAEPLAALAIVCGQMSAMGLPLLAGFAMRLPLLSGLASAHLVAALAVWLAMLGAGVAGIRTLAGLVTPFGDRAPGEPGVVRWRDQLNLGDLFLVLGSLLLLGVGIFPQWVVPFLERLPLAFAH